MNDLEVAERIRAFNRFYTEIIGSLDDRHEGLDLTLAESRVLFTVASLESSSVNEISDRLDLDLAYTSRLLGTLEDGNFISRKISTHDRRQRVVTVTPKGKRRHNEIVARSNKRVLDLISHLDSTQVHELLDAVATVQHLISKQDLANTTRMRDPKTGANSRPGSDGRS